MQGGLSSASSLPGAGVLVTTAVAGGIAILRPFTAASRPFLRDIVFYMVAVFLAFTALYFGRVTLAWALGEQPQAWAGGRHRGTRAGGPTFEEGNPPQAGLSQKKGTYGSDNQRGQGGEPGGMFWIFSVSHFNKQYSQVADCGPQGPCGAHTPLVVQGTWTEAQFTEGSGNPQGTLRCRDIQGSAAAGARERQGDGAGPQRGLEAWTRCHQAQATVPEGHRSCQRQGTTPGRWSGKAPQTLSCCLLMCLQAPFHQTQCRQSSGAAVCGAQLPRAQSRAPALRTGIGSWRPLSVPGITSLIARLWRAGREDGPRESRVVGWRL